MDLFRDLHLKSELGLLNHRIKHFGCFFVVFLFSLSNKILDVVRDWAVPRISHILEWKEVFQRLAFSCGIQLCLRPGDVFSLVDRQRLRQSWQRLLGHLPCYLLDLFMAQRLRLFCKQTRYDFFGYRANFCECVCTSFIDYLQDLLPCEGFFLTVLSLVFHLK